MRQRVILNAPGCSGRGVEIVTLDSDQVDRINEAAAADCPSDATMYALRNRQTQLGIQSMVVGITKKKVANQDELLAAEWEKLDAEKLSTEWKKYFSAKESAILRDMYLKYHVALQTEVDGIMGKAMMVSED